jgi:hypothetical protein
MSHYASFTTTLREADFVVAALRSMGYAVEQSTNAACPLTAKGYGVQSFQAEIVIRKAEITRHHGHCYGDIGFTRTADGTFQATIDDLDEGTMRRDSSGKTLGNWMDRVTQAYTEQAKMSWAISQGYVFAGRETDEQGNVELLFTVRE